MVERRIIRLIICMNVHFTQFRSSHGGCSVRKNALRNFAKFTGKHLCQSLFFNKVAGLRLIVYKDRNSFFKALLKRDNSFTIHHTNFQSLAIELFKVKKNLSNTIMNGVLQFRTLTYNLNSQRDFERSFVNTSRFGLNSLRYFSSEVWNIITSDIRNASNFHIFKNKISNGILKNATVIYAELTSVIYGLLIWSKQG